MESSHPRLYADLLRFVTLALAEPNITTEQVRAYLHGDETALRSITVCLMLDSLMLISRDVRMQVFEEAVSTHYARAPRDTSAQHRSVVEPMGTLAPEDRRAASATRPGLTPIGAASSPPKQREAASAYMLRVAQEA